MSRERDMGEGDPGDPGPEGMREFETGATRDTEDGKLDYEGFLSPFVLERFARFMHKNRVQSDGNLRDADNWQKGIPKSVYMKSMHRHFMDVWKGFDGDGGVEMEESLCALLFNAMGYLFEIIDKPGREGGKDAGK